MKRYITISDNYYFFTENTFTQALQKASITVTCDRNKISSYIEKILESSVLPTKSIFYHAYLSFYLLHRTINIFESLNLYSNADRFNLFASNIKSTKNYLINYSSFNLIYKSIFVSYKIQAFCKKKQDLILRLA